MDNQDDFWERPVTDTVTVELLPGEQPSLRIKQGGRSIVQLELTEARALIEVLTTVVGELYILKKDPSALARLQRLLADDVTMARTDRGRRSATVTSRVSGHVQGQELIRRYRQGGRNFAGADLSLADLEGADLRGVDLSRASLVGANLRRTNLFQANLAGANLVQANLEETGLFQADLQGADLSQANLRRAFLKQADLSGARVTAEQLAQAAMLDGATMPDGTQRD
jgi:uncharacterized protein YjbI with pentapeptide repeats